MIKIMYVGKVMLSRSWKLNQLVKIKDGDWLR